MALAFAYEATYLGAALTAANLIVLGSYFKGEHSSTTAGSRLTYLLFGLLLTYPVFYLMLMVLPQVLGGGG